DVHTAELADIGAEVCSIQRIPELVDDRAATLGEHLSKAGALLVPEGVVLRNGRHLSVALLQRPVGQRPRHLSGRVTGYTNDVSDTLALRQIVGGDDRNEVGDAVSADVIRNRQARIGEEVTEEKVDV